MEREITILCNYLKRNDAIGALYVLHIYVIAESVLNRCGTIFLNSKAG